MSLDVGRGDIGRGDIGRGDIGRGDIGRGDIGRGDIGRGDIGRGDIGRGDIGRGDIGQAAQEIDAAIAAGAGNTPPTGFTACVIGIGACPGNTADPAQNHRIRTAWRPPNVGTVARYHVYRVRADDPAQAKTLAGTVTASAGVADYTLVDPQELPNARFTYLVVAEFNDGPPRTISGPSNFVTVLAVNDAPAAVNDPNATGGSYTVAYGAPLTVPVAGVLGNDTDDDSLVLTARVAAGPSNATLVVNADGSFTYTPNPGFYGADSFSYTANDADPGRASTAAIVSITVLPPPLYGLTMTPLKTAAQQGSAVPIAWTLKDAAGNPLVSLTTLLKLESVFNGAVPAGGCVASTIGIRETLFNLPNGATGGSTFRIVLGGYQFNWDTTTTTTAPTLMGKGCYTVLLYLSDRPDMSGPRLTTPVQLK